jgi:DNA-binding IclR family transcriptional regulator
MRSMHSLGGMDGDHLERPRNRALGHGLAVLQCLVAAEHPLTATEVAHRCGVHQTTASRILADLIAAGYARRVAYREFAPDFGLLTLGLEAARHFHVLTRPRAAMERAARMCPGLGVSLCMLWRDKLLYFDQAAHGLDTNLFEGSDYPLHLSSPGLLFMLELPRAEAAERLRASRAKFGWATPTPKVTASEEKVLTAAAKLRRTDTLVLPGWAGPNHVSGAIRLRVGDDHPLALALAGAVDVMSTESLRMRLREIRAVVEPALSQVPDGEPPPKFSTRGRARLPR